MGLLTRFKAFFTSFFYLKGKKKEIFIFYLSFLPSVKKTAPKFQREHQTSEEEAVVNFNLQARNV